MKKYISIFIIVLFLIFVQADSEGRTGSVVFQGAVAGDKQQAGEVMPDIFRNNIPGITRANMFEKLTEYLDGNSYLSEEAVLAVRNAITRSSDNPVINLINDRVDMNFQLETASKHLENIIGGLSDTQKLMIRPGERYNELKNKIDLIDEQIKTGLRANDTSVIRSIAEYLAYDSKGYEASHIAPVVGAARSHLSNDSVRSSIPVEAVSRLFDSYGEGLTKINDMMQADNTVSEARTHLRTRDGLSRNSEVIDNVLVPYTSIGTDDENIDEDGHIIYDIVYYASKMHKEMPRQFNERKKVHMNLMLDLLKDEMTNVNVNVDHEGESLSPGGDFLSKISGFFEIATKIIGVISNMFFNSESPLDGLSQFFTGLPALSGFVSEGQGATAGLGTAGMASAASGGTSEGSGTTASDESAAAPMDTRSGAGAQRIVRSALAAEGQGRTVHGITCYTATTEWGNKACAAVVSAILRHANTGLNRQILGVVDMEGSLPSIGFRDIRFPPASQFSPGDVVYWRRTRNDRSRHVGVIVSRDNHGTWWAIDNSSSSRRVMKRPVVRSYYPIVSGIAKYTR